MKLERSTHTAVRHLVDWVSSMGWRSDRYGGRSEKPVVGQDPLQQSRGSTSEKPVRV